MNIQFFSTLVLTAVLGSSISLLLAYVLFKDRLLDSTKSAASKAEVTGADEQKAERLQLLPLRLQAHERLILFIERINPSNLFLRHHQQGIAVAELRSLILQEIRAEYQHNVAQQLYVGSGTWEVVRKLKDDTLAMINNAAQGLPEDAGGIDLSRKVLQHLASIE